MVLYNKYLRTFLLQLTWLYLAHGQCTSPSPVVTNATATVIIKNQYVVYTCDNNKEFSSGDSAIPAKCTAYGWTNVSAVCSASYPDIQNCTGIPEIPGDTDNSLSINTSKYKSFICSGSKHWLSGDPVRITQCRRGEWTKIWDICDEGCPVPRDCADVADLGLEENGEYYVIPSGKADGTIHEVTCEMKDSGNNTVNGGKWTHIFGNDISISISKSDSDWINGFNDSSSFFVGLSFLEDISLPTDSRPTIGQVMDILFYDGSSPKNLLYHVAYENFTVGSKDAGYKLLSVGKHHGTAGDGMCYHVNTKFEFDNITANGTHWWGVDDTTWLTIVKKMNGNFLSKKINWAPLDSVLTKLKQVIIRIRPIDDDRELTCPPLVGSEIYWNHTNSSIPYSRLVGTKITWKCIGENFKEGKEGGNRTTEGTITCINATKPYWSNNVTLPCTLECPKDFLLLDDGLRCFLYSGNKTTGFVSASAKCEEQNSTLAVILHKEDVTDGTTVNTTYMVNHAQRGQQTAMVYEALNQTTYTCDTNSICQVNKGNQCTGVRSDPSSQYINCKSDWNYICQMPGWCPENFVRISGACYYYAGATANFTEGLKTCIKYGAGLAYPTTNKMLYFLRRYLAKIMFQNNTNESEFLFYIGLNYVKNTWNLRSDYVMGDLKASLSYNSTNKWQLLSVTANDSKFIAVNFTYKKNTTYLVCQYPGPLECSETPQKALDNMTLSWDNVSYTEFSTAVYTCHYGYFVNENTSVVNQTVTCYGMLSEWYPPVLLPCIRVAVCQKSLPSVHSNKTTNRTDAESFYLDGTISYSCPLGMAFSDLTTSLNTTCISNGTSYGYSVSDIPSCKVCLGDVIVPNATSSWSNTSTYEVGEWVNVTCKQGYEYAYHEVSLFVNCTDSGWNWTGVKECYRICAGNPPVAGENVMQVNMTSNKVGHILSYQCFGGYSFRPTNTSGAVSKINVSCLASGEWENPLGSLPYECTLICADDPPSTPSNATSNWDKKSREVDDMVTYTCNDNFLFGNFSKSWNVTCNGTIWGLSDSSLFVCSQMCMKDPPTLPKATPDSWPAKYGKVGDSITYRCNNYTVNKDGNRSVVVTCTTNGWVNSSSSFLCEKACAGPPSPPSTGATYNYTGDYREGVLVTYVCNGEFSQYYQSTLNSECMNGSWTITDITECAPKTNYTRLEPYGKYEQHYSLTSNYSWSEFQESFKSTSGKENGYTDIAGPFGFGTGTGLQSKDEQCLMKEKFVPTTETCIYNPKNCKSGLSLSIWEKHDNYPNFLETVNLEDNKTNYKYIMSTGGDVDGHPGIALAHDNHWLVVIVSAGDIYWKVRVLAITDALYWNNIGLVWNNTDEGLKVYVNLTKVGQERVPKKSPGAKTGLDPMTLMIGCHKDQDNQVYRGYNNAGVDELAIWDWALADQKNKLEILMFYGGYREDYSSITPEMLAGIVKNVDMSDPAQYAIVATLSSSMTEEKPASPTAATPTATTSQVSSTSSSPTSGSDVAATQDPESIKEMESFAQILQSLMNPDALPSSITQKEMDNFLKGNAVMSNLFAKSNGPKWLGLQKKQDTYGSSQAVWNKTLYQKTLLQRLYFPNGSEPIYFTSAEKNLYDQMCKMSMDQFSASGSMFKFPKMSPEDYANMNSPIAQAGIPLSAFSSGDEGCQFREVNVASTIYDTASDFIYKGVHPGKINPNLVYDVDSRILSFNVDVQPAYDEDGNIDATQPSCNPDKAKMKSYPVRIKLEHNEKVQAMRKLQFHENEINTDVEVRRCVRWNANYSDYGFWDPTGCVVMSTSTTYTKCACNNFGVFAILAQKTEPIEIKEEATWLYVLKIVLYAVSAVAIVIYILVVAMSRDLHDQLHLIGVNIAFAILCGSIAMFFGRDTNFADDRHLCVAIGILIHFFYLGVGLWSFMLGFASFQAITTGIIGGRLPSYMFVCWGLDLISVGVLFFEFMNELGTDPRCFLAWDNNVKMIFFIPQIILCWGGLFYAIVILCNASTSALRKENLIEDYGSFSKGTALLLIHLCVTWTFGLLTYMRLGFSNPDFNPIFQVLNSSAGLCLLIFIGVGSNRFRMFVTGKGKTRRKMVKTYAFGLPSVMEDDDTEYLTKANRN